MSRYAVRVMYADRSGTFYANEQVIERRGEANMLVMVTTLEKATSLCNLLVSREGLDNVAVVRLSKYPPYPEIDVVVYRRPR